MFDVGVLTSLNENGEPFTKAAEYGMKTAQIVNWDMSLLNETVAARVRKNIEDTGVRIAAFWAGFSGRCVWNVMEGPGTIGIVPRDMRAKRVADLKHGADFAKMIGAPAIVTHCGFIPDNPRSAEYIEVLNAIYEVAIYCWNLNLGFWFETGQETPYTLLRAIEDLRLPNIGINLDTANLIIYGNGNPVDAMEMFGQYVRCLHAKDALFPQNGYVHGHEVPIGQGKVDFHSVITKLYERGFEGDIIIEREISGEEQARDILSGKAYLEAIIKDCRASSK